MNPIAHICYSCGMDVILEPEVMEEEEAKCYECGDYLFEWATDEVDTTIERDGWTLFFPPMKEGK